MTDTFLEGGSRGLSQNLVNIRFKPPEGPQIVAPGEALFESPGVGVQAKKES